MTFIRPLLRSDHQHRISHGLNQRAMPQSLPCALERRLGLVLLELTKRCPRVSKRIQPVCAFIHEMEHSRLLRLRIKGSHILCPKQPKAPPTARLFATSNGASQGMSMARRRYRSARPGKQICHIQISSNSALPVRIYHIGRGTCSTCPVMP